MLFIHKTISLCNTCYRHIPAIVYELDGAIRMSKKCEHHGIMDSVVEIDSEFYYSLNHHHYPGTKSVLFEVTDRCNLNCPHCYHLPDNRSTDRNVESIIEQMKQFPVECTPLLAGAEPTMHSNFIELCNQTKQLNFDKINILTNGLKLANKQFAKDVYATGVNQITLGLNHPSYQGQKVHNRQLKALSNVLELGFTVGYVGYTIESLDHVDFILSEIDKIDNPLIQQYRIRCGSFIGRSSDPERSYLSNLVKKVKSILGDQVSFGKNDDNPYHVIMHWGNRRIRLIQWPDVTNIDMEELNCGPWCNFYPGPITNFVHQVITRDAFINNQMPMLDRVPAKYEYKHIRPGENDYWKTNWTGPVPFSEFDWSIDSEDMNPRSSHSFKILPIGKE
jgi:uncharacterized radical SAM superfamily Fe-S cluster-containing enzyme